MSRADFNDGTAYVIDMGDGSETQWKFSPSDHSDAIVIEHSYDIETDYYESQVIVSVPKLIDWLRRSGRLT